MTRSSLVAVGAVLNVFGLVWFLQGIGVLGGSDMSGDAFWAIVGGVMIIAGVTILVRAERWLR